MRLFVVILNYAWSCTKLIKVTSLEACRVTLFIGVCVGVSKYISGLGLGGKNIDTNLVKLTFPHWGKKPLFLSKHFPYISRSDTQPEIMKSSRQQRGYSEKTISSTYTGYLFQKINLREGACVKENEKRINLEGVVAYEIRKTWRVGSPCLEAKLAGGGLRHWGNVRWRSLYVRRKDVTPISFGGRGSDRRLAIFMKK